MNPVRCLDRRVLAALLLAASFAWAAVEEAKANGAKAPPNVLLIMSDDLRPQLGCYGDELVQTPRIDRLSEQSLRFERAYVQCAVCSPSRNSLLSGLRPNTTGLRGFGVRVRQRVPDIVTLPQHFKRNGYHTKAIGKIFHIYAESMLGSEDDPESWSEPLQLPEVPVWGPEQTRLRERLIAEARAAGKVFDHPHDWPRARTWDDSDVPDEAMQDGNTAAMAAEFLRTRGSDSAPFFLAVGFLRPHLPFNAPRRYWDLYDPDSLTLPTYRRRAEASPAWAVNQGIVKNYYEMPPFETIDDGFLRRYLQAYLACISYVDACTGKLLDALDEAGLADNTIVVFLGDHGYQMGEYDSWGHKHSNFEISTRAPLLVSVPGAAAAGRVTETPTEFLDLYPSLCELAGLEIPPHVEGKSFAPLLEDPTRRHRQAAGSEMMRRGRLGRSIRTDRYRYTQWRDAEGKLVAEELYDHQAPELQPPEDASYNGELEIINVADRPAYAEVVRELDRKLQALIPADAPVAKGH